MVWACRIADGISVSPLDIIMLSIPQSISFIQKPFKKSLLLWSFELCETYDLVDHTCFSAAGIAC